MDNKNHNKVYNVAVIGGGTGGYVSAIKAAQKGLKVLLVEKDKLGGTCLNSGCIPTKSFLSDVKALYRIKTSPVYKGMDQAGIDLGQMVKRKNQVVKGLVDGLTSIIRSRGIELVRGKAELLKPGLIRVDQENREYRTENIIIATGSSPSGLPSVSPDGEHIITSEEALNPKTIPENMLIIGGGVIGVEIASIYRTMGTNVTILEMLPSIVPEEDEDASKVLEGSLKKQGINILVNSKVSMVEKIKEMISVTWEDNQGKENNLEVKKVLLAVGRSPNLAGIDLNKLGIKNKDGFIQVNSRMETSVRGIYAVGDVVGGTMLAHVASEEGEVAVENISGNPRDVNYNTIPTAIYTFPEVASVGLSEKEAKESGRNIRLGKFSLMHSGRAKAEGKTEGFVKIIGDADTEEILGATIVGELAAELIGEIVLGLNVEALVEDFSMAVKPHPTISETIKEAALSWEGRPLHMTGKGSRG